MKGKLFWKVSTEVEMFKGDAALVPHHLEIIFGSVSVNIEVMQQSCRRRPSSDLTTSVAAQPEIGLGQGLNSTGLIHSCKPL